MRPGLRKPVLAVGIDRNDASPLL